MLSEDTLFQQVIQLPEASRSAYLDVNCPDPFVRARIEAKIAAETILRTRSNHVVDATGDYVDVERAENDSAVHDDGKANNPSLVRTGTATTPDRTGEYLNPEQTGDLTSTESAGEDRSQHPIIAGRYHLIQPIGEGGMGTVWLAEQFEPVKRRVAVKLIRVDRGSSKSILARFDAERQAIALMDHPHIAKLFDAGTTKEGSPFFVMELVKGIPLNEYCDQHQLSIQDRLQLFSLICSAVHHAHQKGIIHRDLKPSNILVERHDQKAIPKVIDFGLAKATTGIELHNQSLDTSFGSVLGTPLYMAPEQADFNAVDIDTRADVYALGVILYELLTGTTPLTRETIQRAAIDEMLRMIREDEAPSPSSRWSSSESRPAVAANRGIDPAKLGRLLKGELDWIVLKALNKEREQRYDSAKNLGTDIERFLNNEPVMAGPPSSLYRLRKFVRRNRVQVVAASFVVFALVVGFIGTTLGLLEARRQTKFAQEREKEANDQRNIAEAETAAKEAARKEEEKQRNLAQDNARLVREQLLKTEIEKKRADDERQIARSVNQFLQNKLLKQADTFAQENRLVESGRQAVEAKQNPTIRELLDVAKAELAPDLIEANFPKQPLVQAELLRTVGDAFRGVGEAPTAIELLSRSREMFQHQQGDDHPETLTTTSRLALAHWAKGEYERAIELFEESYQRQSIVLGVDHLDTFTTITYLGMTYIDAGKVDKAMPLFQKAYERSLAKFGDRHPTTMRCRSDLAKVYQANGQADRAVPLLEEYIQLNRERLGPDHSNTLSGVVQLGICFNDLGRPDRAVPLFEEVYRIRKQKYGPNHPFTPIDMNNLAFGYLNIHRADLAIPLFEDVLKIRRDKLGDDHPATILSMNNLVGAYRVIKKTSEAIALGEEALQRNKRILGEDHPQTFTSMNNLALSYVDAAQLNRAVELYENCLRLMKMNWDESHPLTLSVMHNLGNAYLKLNQFDKALSLFEVTVQRRKVTLGREHPDTVATMKILGATYWNLKRFDQASPLFEELLILDTKRFGRNHESTQRTLANLGVISLGANRPDVAVPMLEEAYRSSRQFPALNWVGGPLIESYAKVGNRAEMLNVIQAMKERAYATNPKGSPQLGLQFIEIGIYLMNGNANAEAEPLIRESLMIFQSTRPGELPTFQARAYLGRALLGQEKFEEAESMLREAYEGMKANEKSIPPNARKLLPETLDALMKLSVKMNRLDQARKYESLRANYPFTRELLPRPKTID